MVPIRLSLRGPWALHSRMTMRVDAAAVSVAIAPSSSATFQPCPSARAPMMTIAAAMVDWDRVIRSTAGPMARTRSNSNTEPMEKRISPRATSLNTLRAARFSWLTHPSTEGPTATPARMYPVTSGIRKNFTRCPASNANSRISPRDDSSFMVRGFLFASRRGSEPGTAAHPVVSSEACSNHRSAAPWRH